MLGSPKTPSWLGFTSCFTLVVARAFPRLLSPELWAEDGYFFLKDALAMGWASLLKPSAGYFHTFQRVTVLSLLEFIPTPLFALFIVIVSLSVLSFVASRIVTEDYEWLLPSFHWRLALSLSFLMAPGLTEMAGNLANINWILTGYLALLALKNRHSSIKTWELGFILLILVSVGTALITLPLYLFRFYFLQKSPKKTLSTVGVGILYVGLLLLARDAFYLSEEPIAFKEWFLVYQRNFRTSILLQPLFGDSLTILLSTLKWRSFGGLISYSLLFSVIYWIYKRRQNPDVWFLVIYVLSYTTWLFMIWVGRRGSLEAFQNVPSEWFFAHRYSFPMVWPSLLFLFVILYSLLQSRSRFSCLAYCGYGVFILMTLMNFHRFSILPYGNQHFWKEDSEPLTRHLKTGCPPAFTVRVYPNPDFNVYVRGNRSKESCDTQ